MNVCVIVNPPQFYVLATQKLTDRMNMLSTVHLHWREQLNRHIYANF